MSIILKENFPFHTFPPLSFQPSNTTTKEDSFWPSWLPEAKVQVTELRKDPAYINYYQNWFMLLSTGVVPMVLLIFLNVNIYKKVLETS